MFTGLKNLFFAIVLYPLWNAAKKNDNSKLILMDVGKWLYESHIEIKYSLKNFAWLMNRCNAFRNLLYYRMDNNISKVYRCIYKPLDSLYFMTPQIGGGLFIQHGFATIIAAKSIGENCWINQQVTIGFSTLTDAPIIGNNVTINAGAKVIGGINIGDNSKIGAGAVIVKNVPANCTVVGSEAYIVKRDGIKVNREPLQ